MVLFPQTCLLATRADLAAADMVFFQGEPVNTTSAYLNYASVYLNYTTI